MRVTLELVDADDPRLEMIWRGLESRSNGSYFLSWGWIETWLACVPRVHRPKLAVLSDAGAPIAACLIGERCERRHHLVPSCVALLNETGIARYDALCIEHNGLLHGAATRFPASALLELLPNGWDELHVSAIDAGEVASIASSSVIRIDREVGAPFVDLEKVRSSPGGYLALLHANTRAQIRRARRGSGELHVESAATLDQARDIYNELVEVHERSWHARGQSGAFADPWVDAFHRQLIARRFHTGEIELVRVTASGHTLGCLYNYVYKGRVVFYQGGMAAHDDPRRKPGLVCHAAAIEHAASAGHAVYDFLGGDARYKHSLATGETKLVWARIQRRRARFALEERLRGWKRAVAKLRGVVTHAA